MTNSIMLWLSVLPALLGLALVAWAIATVRRNAGLVDIFWPLFFLLACGLSAVQAPATGVRSWLLIGLVLVWSVRLATYLGMRNWNASEDHRYRAIRARNEPGFNWKSVYLVFGLQAVLAWVIAAPLVGVLVAVSDVGVLDGLGAMLAMFGLVFEAVADAQLTRFKADPANAGGVMMSGLWRYTRHPNYFGEFCVWWGLYLIALSAGAGWTVFSPLLMTLLLLKVSGVALLEKDIAVRRPAYRDYVMQTNAFFPGRSRRT